MSPQDKSRNRSSIRIPNTNHRVTGKEEEEEEEEKEEGEEEGEEKKEEEEE